MASPWRAQPPASMKGKTAKEVAREIENADPVKVVNSTEVDRFDHLDRNKKVITNLKTGTDALATNTATYLDGIVVGAE